MTLCWKLSAEVSIRQKSADESESLEALEKEMEEADNEEGNVEEVSENDDTEVTE